MSTFVYTVNNQYILAKRAELTKKGIDIDSALEDLQNQISMVGAFAIVDGPKRDGHPDVSTPSKKVIYLWRDANATGRDPFEEWIYTTTNTWQLIGETSMDLSDYARTADVEALISSLDADVSSTGGTNVAVRVTEVNGKITAVNITKDETVNISDYNVKMGQIDGSITGINTNIANLGANKADKVANAVGNNFAGLDSNGNLKDSGKKASDFVDATAYETRVSAIETDVADKANKVNPATAGNFAGLNSNGDLTDSGKSASDFATAAQGAKADSAIQGVKCNTNAALTPNANGVVTIPEANASTYGVVTVGYTEIEDLNSSQG